MAISIVLPKERVFVKDAHHREHYVDQKACQQAQEECAAYLRELDDPLLKHTPQGWQVVGKRRRTMVTCSGKVGIERRLYRDEHGQAHFLLDEYLELPPQQAATPRVTETVVHRDSPIQIKRSLPCPLSS